MGRVRQAHTQHLQMRRAVEPDGIGHASLLKRKPGQKTLSMVRQGRVIAAPAPHRLPRHRRCLVQGGREKSQRDQYGAPGPEFGGRRGSGLRPRHVTRDRKSFFVPLRAEAGGRHRLASVFSHEVVFASLETGAASPRA